jgi:sec-independent protein translocase protein TatB
MDSFFGIGIGELFFIAVIALIVLGPERLPGALREVAKFIRTIRNLTNELTSQFGDEMKVFDELNPQKILRDLAEDPDEKAKAAKTTAASKPAAKPAAKPATSSTTKPATKPATPKPATTKPATTSTAKPAVPKPAVAPKTAGAAATSKPATIAKPAGEDAVATMEGAVVAVEDAPVAENPGPEGTAVAATLPEARIVDGTLLNDTAIAEDADTMLVEEPRLEAPEAEADALPSSDELTILPPERLERALAEQIEAVHTDQIDASTAETQSEVASIVEDIATDTEHVADAVTDTALETAPEPSDTTVSDISVSDTSAADIVEEATSEATAKPKRSPAKVNSASVNGTSNGTSAESKT